MADGILAGRIALVTGASRGIGRGVATSLAVPADVAAAVVWFVGGANGYCAGQKLNIDGAGQATFR